MIDDKWIYDTDRGIGNSIDGNIRRDSIVQWLKKNNRNFTKVNDVYKALNFNKVWNEQVSKSKYDHMNLYMDDINMHIESDTKFSTELHLVLNGVLKKILHHH